MWKGFLFTILVWIGWTFGVGAFMYALGKRVITSSMEPFLDDVVNEIMNAACLLRQRQVDHHPFEVTFSPMDPIDLNNHSKWRAEIRERHLRTDGDTRVLMHRGLGTSMNHAARELLKSVRDSLQSEQRACEARAQEIRKHNDR